MKVHLERGGLAPRARSHHPVTMVLSKMKREGQANNPRQGYWLIPSSTQDEDSVDSELDNLDPERLSVLANSRFTSIIF